MTELLKQQDSAIIGYSNDANNKPVSAPDALQLSNTNR
jgi:hypothetical protein